MDISKNIKDLKSQIKAIQDECHLEREIKICAATKYVGPTEMKILYDQGISIMGENRVEALLTKQELLRDLPLSWHFIGSLQTNKVKKMINRIQCLHSLDRIHLAKEIQNHRKEVLDCFVEVNGSNEASKQGIILEDVASFILSLEKYDKIRVIGLMTMAMNTEDQAIIQATFKQVKSAQLAIESLQLPFAPCHECSMGMSHDFHLAIPMGATIIRIGSRLFQ